MVIVVFTDTIPRHIAINVKDSFAVKCVGVVKLLISVLSVFSTIASVVSTLICKIIRVPVSSEKDVVTEEEILMMVEAGNEKGIIEENQRTMINNIFEFGDVTVSEVMTHRTDLVSVDVNTKISQIVTLAINEGFSRIPVYENTIDNIIGVLYIKDLLCLIGYEKIDEIDISQFIRKVMYVPETSKCNDVFEKMTLKKAQIAIVVDEYGGTAGMVTMEDLLEEIVGNIQDEYDDEEAELSEISEGVYVIDGSADPEDILPQLKVILPDDHNYDTMSALFVDILGRIPNRDETPSVEYQGLELTALVTEDNWVTKIKARIMETEQIEQGID
jgi:putative hemolysin